LPVNINIIPLIFYDFKDNKIPFHLQYTVSILLTKKTYIITYFAGDIIEHKRKKAFDHFTIPTQIMDSVKTGSVF